MITVSYNKHMTNVKEAAATQQFIEIEEIKQDTVLLRGGGLRKILLTNGVNFDLKSEEEQGLIIYSFQNLLNSLNFSLQIFIRSRKINIDPYLEKLVMRQNQEETDLLKNIIGEYRQFVQSFVAQNAIMEKDFFVVVPYDPIQLPAAGKSFFKKIWGWLTKKKAGEEEELETKAVAQKNFQQNIQQLEQRVDEVMTGLNQIGLRAAPLNEQEIIELFYNIYNPEAIEKRMEQNI